MRRGLPQSRKGRQGSQSRDDGNSDFSQEETEKTEELTRGSVGAGLVLFPSSIKNQQSSFINRQSILPPRPHCPLITSSSQHDRIELRHPSPLLLFPSKINHSKFKISQTLPPYLPHPLW
jgi:hypothetical protein